MSSALMLHRGAVQVDRQALSSFEAPPPTDSWFPLKHSQVLEQVSTTLAASGYRITREQLGVARDSHRFFGVLDVDSTLAQGVTLAVGIRNSTDKSFPLGFCAGSRVFVCDNLAFRAELLVRKKHTRYGEMRFSNAIAGAVAQLRSFQAVEAERIRRLQHTPCSEAQASHLLVRAMHRKIVSPPSLPRIWKEIVTPSFDYGTDGLTLWTVFQSFTTVLGERAKRSPSEYCGMTMRLNALLLPEEAPQASPA